MIRIWLLVVLMTGASLALPAVSAAGLAVQVAQEEPEPAVVVDQTPPAEADPAWTFRYLVPTLVVMALALVAGTWLVYYVRIKKRYRVKNG